MQQGPGLMYPRQVYWLALALTVIAVVTFSYKYFVLQLPLSPDTTVDVWNVEVKATFDAQKLPVKLSLYLPRTQGRFEIIDEHFISGDYGLVISREENNRKATWSVRSADGKQYLLYKATLRSAVSPLPPGNGDRTPNVRSEIYTDHMLVAATHVFNSVHKRSADTESLVTQLLTELAAKPANENIQLLLGNDTSLANRAAVAANILEVGGIPAHVVHGVELSQLQRNSRRVHWLEVFYQKNWHEFNPVDASPRIPKNYLPWWRDKKPLLTLDGGRNLATKISLGLDPQYALQQRLLSGQQGPSRMIEYSLLSLPVETQALYHVILMVPIGVLFLVLMRNLVGVKTFGTFMPILIALAFRETRLLWGLSLFILVVGMGLTFRFYFDRLKLLLVPRLASVLIVVILLMGAVSILSYKLGLPNGLSIALFPMVIMTMTIERMSIVWEERGPMEALKQGFGSLTVAAFAYLLMNIDLLRHFIFVFPETLLILLAITILLGRYSGYRLTELVRFKVLAEKR